MSFPYQIRISTIILNNIRKVLSNLRNSGLRVAENFTWKKKWDKVLEMELQRTPGQMV